MRQEPISLRRRHLLIAAVVAAAAPATAFAATWNPPGEEARRSKVDGSMIVSGRILRRNGQPLSGALVHAWRGPDEALLASTTTDADGRFMLKMVAATAYTDRSAHINYRVTHPQHATLTSKLHFIRAPGVADNQVARLQHDDAGVWRTTFGVTLA